MNITKIMLFVFLIIFIFFTHNLSIFAATYYVDGSRVNDLGDGTSWSTAKKYIKSGIALMRGGDTLIIRDG
ncbi:MAG: hypothetical protein N2606_03890, partial [Candidatus Omnitrophica bacterium]|nr:hypothetical protein [Candidatus Omnitrophota bacterium]